MEKKIIGSITRGSNISGNIRDPSKISAEIRMPAEKDSTPDYEGSYAVTPRLYEQSLDTNGKKMKDDVKVYEIPVIRTSNLQGGQTVLIG